MNFFRQLCVAAATASFIGCASTPGQAPVAPPTSAPDGKALVFVYRDYAAPTAWSTTILAGGTEVAALSQKTYTWFTASPGSIRVRASWPVLSGQHDTSIGLDLEAGRVYYLELTGVSQLVGAYVHMGSSLDERAQSASESKMKNGCKPIVPATSP